MLDAAQEWASEPVGGLGRDNVALSVAPCPSIVRRELPFNTSVVIEIQLSKGYKPKTLHSLLYNAVAKASRGSARVGQSFTIECDFHQLKSLHSS